MSGRTSHVLAKCLVVALVLLGVAGRADANLVANGDFESGDFSGWSHFGDGLFDGVDSVAPQSGAFAAYFGAIDGSGISQTIATTAGGMFQVDFWLQTESDINGVAVPNHFEFDWDGASQLALTDASAGVGYTHYSFLLAASSASTTLTFSFLSVPAFWDFDTVSVTSASTVPEPGSLALLGLAGALATFARRRRA
jgi:PEP-CTERM motif-containing protein